MFCARNVFEDIFPEIAEFFFGDGPARRKQSVMLALPVIIEWGGFEAVKNLEVKISFKMRCLMYCRVLGGGTH
jgi:hypothetical protein